MKTTLLARYSKIDYETFYKHSQTCVVGIKSKG